MNGRATAVLLLACATAGCGLTEFRQENSPPLPERFAASFVEPDAGSLTQAPGAAQSAAEGAAAAIESRARDGAAGSSDPRAVQPVAAYQPVQQTETGSDGETDSGEAENLPPPSVGPLDVAPEPIERELPEPALPPSAATLPFGPDRPLHLEDVVDSMVETFPLAEAAIWERAVFEGKALEATGAWDLKMKGEHIAQPLGYYKNYRTKVGLEQPWYEGGYSSFQYRVGDGYFEPWYKERETDEGGEFEAAIGVPLWGNRTIDEWRAKLWTARVDRQAVEPEIQSRLIDFSFQASLAYWDWVEAGQQYLVQKQLLELIRARTLQLEERFRRQDIAELELIDNDRGLAKREEKLIASERKLQSAALKLSLFLRTPSGDPIVPKFEWLPPGFPERHQLDAEAIERDVQTALVQRPELRAIQLDQERQRIEIAQAQNLMLPNATGLVIASQDVGARATPTGDKKPFELEAGIAVDMPFQRRKAAGRQQAARAKLVALERKREYTEDKIVAEVRDSVSAMFAASERVERAARNRDRSEQLVELERFALANGDSTLFRLNLREQDLIDSAILYNEALGEYFRAEASYRASLGESYLAP